MATLGCGDRFDGRLLGLRKALEREREFRIEQLVELAGDARHCWHVGQASEEPFPARIPHEIAATLAAGARHALDEIDRALHRMEVGDYGTCQDCAEQIPLVVLTAIPQTSLCLSCRSRRDAQATEPAGTSTGELRAPDLSACAASSARVGSGP
jgi:RNA polymerase-binding transcription factor DksA